MLQNDGFYTPGFLCDGRRDLYYYKTGKSEPTSCPTSITVRQFYGAINHQGWTLTRDGKAYCGNCTPTHNPVHRCPDPEPAPSPRHFVAEVKGGEITLTPRPEPPAPIEPEPDEPDEHSCSCCD
ncbi:hypothetical protein [Streptomyces inusitatus]|nr:hypothetical protein [Streptomyces inusitatus]